MKETIIIDVDGVLLDWKANVRFMMNELGMTHKLVRDYDHHSSSRNVFIDVSEAEYRKLIGVYNEHPSTRYLPAFPDAYDALRELSKTYKIIALSKFGWSRTSWANRMFNLNSHFGKMVDELICIEYAEKKSEYINKLCNDHDVKFFIDDRLDNIYDVNENTNVVSIFVDREAHPDNALALIVADLRNDAI